MRGTGATLLSVVFLATLLAGRAGAASACGDCNLDGTLSIVDALTAAQHAAGISVPTPAALVACDVDASTLVSIADALVIARTVAGLPAALVCPTARDLIGLRAVRALGAATAYDDTVSLDAGGRPLILVEAGATEQLVLEATFLLPPTLVDVASATSTDGATTYAVTGAAVTVSPDGLIAAGSANDCAEITATFTPSGVTASGAPRQARFVACVDLGGPDDAPLGDRSTLGLGELDVTLPGSPSGPIPSAAGGAMLVWVDVQAGASILAGYQVTLTWMPAAPTLILDPTFGGAGAGGPGDFGVSSTSPVTGLPLSPMDFGPLVNTDNALGTSAFLDLNSTYDPQATGVVRVAVLRFIALGGAATTATISGLIQGVVDDQAQEIGPPAPRPLVAGAGSFRLP